MKQVQKSWIERFKLEALPNPFICSECDAGYDLELDDIHRHYYSGCFDPRDFTVEDWLYWVCDHCGSKNIIPGNRLQPNITRFLFKVNSEERRTK